MSFNGLAVTISGCPCQLRGCRVIFLGGFRVNFVVSVSSMGLPFQLLGLLCEYLSFPAICGITGSTLGSLVSFGVSVSILGPPCQFVGFRVNFGVSMSISGSL